MKSFFDWFFSLFKKKDAPVIQLPTQQKAPSSPDGSAPSAPIPNPTLTPPPAAPEPSKCFGVDVSGYQEAIDWQRAFSDAFRFAGIRATSYVGGKLIVDPMVSRHRSGARAAGLITYLYHFFRFDLDPIAQADFFLLAAGEVLSGELPLCLDLEWDNTSKDLGYHDADHGGTRQTLDEKGALAALACLQRLEAKTGMVPILYTNPYFFTGIRNPERFAKYIPWLSAYVSSEDKIHTAGLPWKKLVFWQKSEHLVLRGANGSSVQNCDLDVFEGTYAELRALCRK
jgi:lysozyme